MNREQNVALGTMLLLTLATLTLMPAANAGPIGCDLTACAAATADAGTRDESECDGSAPYPAHQYSCYGASASGTHWIRLPGASEGILLLGAGELVASFDGTEDDDSCSLTTENNFACQTDVDFFGAQWVHNNRTGGCVTATATTIGAGSDVDADASDDCAANLPIE